MIKKLRYLFTLMLLFVASVSWAEDVTDVLTASSFAATGTTYTDFSGVSATSDAKYAGNSAKSSDGAIQMRSKNSNSGIVSTTSGGKVKSVTITVGSGANTIDVYGSNNAYTAASDLYDSSKQGTKVGSLSTTGTITFEDDYEYIGIRSNNGAIYLTKVEIVWEKGAASTVAMPTFNPAAGEVASGTEVTITAPEGCTVAYTIDGTTDPKENLENAIPSQGNVATIVITEDVTIKAVSVDSEDNTSDVVEATYTIKQETPQYETVSLPYEETFASGIGKFSIEDVVLGEGLGYVWKHDASYKYMKASAYVGGNKESESWLVSPVIDASSVQDVITFTFSQCINRYFGNVEEEATVWIKEEAGSWSQLTITYPEITSGNWSKMTEQTLDISSYAGKKFQIGFKYVSSSSAAGTWEVNNIIVAVGEQLADPELSFSENSYTAIIGESNSFPVLQNPNELDVTYRVSNSNVATIDGTSGEITLVAAGQTTVYAEFAGNDEYKEGSASYTLIVKEKSIAGTDKFELVTDASTLADGDVIILVGSNESKYYALSTTQNTNNRSAEEISVEADGTIIPGSTVQQITLEDGWYFNVGNGYLYAASSSKNYLRTEDEADDNAKATIAIGEGGATILFQGSNTRNLMCFNPNISNNNPLFSCYESTPTNGSLPQIYRKVKDVEETVTVEFGTAGYATRYYENKNLQIPEGVTAYTATVDGTSITLNEIQTGYIPAKTAVVLKGTAERSYDFPVVAEATELTVDNDLQGCETQTTISEEGYKYYVLSTKEGKNPGFYYAVEGGASVNCAANRAYLAVPSSTSTGAKGYPFEDDATGIEGLNVNDNVNANEVYDLQGRRVARPTKGIYIVNGKKVVIKK